MRRKVLYNFLEKLHDSQILLIQGMSGSDKNQWLPEREELADFDKGGKTLLTGKYLLTLKYGGGLNFGHTDFLYNDAWQR